MAPLWTRRQFGSWATSGLASVAALNLLGRDGILASEGTKPIHAKRAIQISVVGGMSHVDSFDYKPELIRKHGQKLSTDTRPDVFFNQVGRLRQPDWKFQQRGQSGLWISDLFPHLAKLSDELTIINSMTADSANHTPALFVQNSGFQFNGYPALGSWLSYGLGQLTDDLPAFVVLADGRGDPTGASSNWTNGFLPAQHQGVLFRGGDSPVRDLFPKVQIPAAEEEESLNLLQQLNQHHAECVGADDDLQARMQSYQLAARMQLAVPEVADLSEETAKTKTLYGLDQPTTQDAGQRCLLARRLLEKGVRFVQIYSGGPIGGAPRTSWDAHENVKENHTLEAARIDQPVAALLQDLKQRGMLDDTLVLFTTEFGRTPFAQSAADVVGTGRDHNRYVFSCWLAGAGLKPGIAYGSSDEIGWKVGDKAVPWHDFHATVLHQFGIDHEKLSHYHNGIQRRLTNVHGEVIHDLLK